MIKISDYIEKIYTDFQVNTSKMVNLCNLKSLNYRTMELPDYNDILIQQLYLLKYAYSYAYEYYLMYHQAIRELAATDEISVVSIGCGALIDYAGLKGIFPNKIHYTGIDKVNWNYKSNIRPTDRAEILAGMRAENYFDKLEKLNADIYMFPKSISEISYEEIQKIAGHFSKKQNEKNAFCLCVSLRNTPGRREEDMRKMEILSKGIEESGYCPGDRNWYFYTFQDGGKGIKAYEKEYSYPEHVIQGLTQLNTKCKTKESCGCYAECSGCLNRYPILRTGEICYRIMKFERRAA